VPQSLYDKDKVTRYREAATELHKLRVETGQQIESAIESGDKAAARSALEELKARGAEFHKLRETLTARDLFVAKYNIQVHGPHEVSFVLPKGVSRFEMLREGQELVSERKLVYPAQLKEWQTEEAFTASSHTPERIRINARVQGGDAQDRATQETLVVESLGHTLPTLEDLAAAFVANYVATGEPLFGWWENTNFTYVVRAAGGALVFFSYGLGANGIGDVYSFSDVAVAALVPRNLKN
jgi:hypothetical protein